MLPKALLALVALLLGSVTLPAHAFPSSRLTFSRGQGAEECPDESVLRKAVVERLGYDPFFPWADMTILARITSESGRFVGIVELLDKAGLVKGARELTAPPSQCTELVSSMALAISIAIDPQSLDRGGAKPLLEAAAEPEPAPEFWDAKPAAVVADTPPPSRPRAVPPRAPWKVEVEGGVAGAAAFAPGLATGPGAGVRLRRGRYSVGIEGRYLFAFDRAVAGVRELASSVAEMSLSGCAAIAPFFGCAVASAGVLTVEGQNVSAPRTESVAMFRAGPRAGLEWVLAENVGLRAHVDAAFNLTRPTVELDGVEAWEASLLAGLLGISAFGRFP